MHHLDLSRNRSGRSAISYTAQMLSRKMRKNDLTTDQKDLEAKLQYLDMLPVAFRTLRETARQDSSFKDIEIECVDHSHTLKLSSQEEVKVLMDEIKDGEELPGPKPSCRPKDPFKTVCHAEIQLLYRLEYISNEGDSPDLYFGCNKRACWLCQKFLTHYQSKHGQPYRTLGSHGQVYTNWNTSTMVVDEGSKAHMCLVKVHEAMLDILKDPQHHEQVSHDSDSDTSADAA